MGLVELREVGEAGVVARQAVETRDVVEDDEIAGGILLMVLHRGAEDVEILRVAERGGHFGRAIGLHAEFRAEAELFFLVAFDRMPRVPDVPEMAVAGGLVVVAFLVALGIVGRAGPVGGCVVVFGHGGREDAGEDVLVGLFARGGFEDFLRHLLDLIIAAPEGEAGAVRQAGHLVFGLGLHGGEIGFVAGVLGAGEHKVLPDQQAFLVAEVIKIGALINPATPDADHVHVGGGGAGEKIVEEVAARFVNETVGGNPVRALGKNRASIDDELEALTEFIGMAVKDDGAQTDAFAPGVEHLAVVDEFKIDGVERLVAVAMGPPQFRISDFGFSILKAWPWHRIRCSDLRHDLAVEGNGAADFPRTFFRKARGDGEFYAILAMRLRDVDGLDAVGGPRFQPDGFVNPARGKAGTPIPAEGTLLFPQQGPAADRVVPLGEVRRFFVRPDVLHRTGEGNLQSVFPRPHGLRDIETVGEEHVVRAGDPMTVQRDGGEGVEAFGHEVEMFLVAGSEIEFAAVLPVAFLDPLQIFFVRAPKGVGDEFVAEQVGVDAAGNPGGEPAVGVVSVEGPAFVERGDCSHVVNHSLSSAWISLSSGPA